MESPHQLPEHPHTVLETEEEISRALRLLAQGQAAEPGPVVQSPATARAAPVVTSSARLYHPYLRPSVATLCVLDDGKPEGEIIRVRSDRFIIGRTEGDLLLPHDSLISSRHVEISRQRIGEQFRWVITDLQTTNGLFVRVSRTMLTDKCEFLVGSGRYRFEAPKAAHLNAADHLKSNVQPGMTRPWGMDVAPSLCPVLVDVTAGQDGERLTLNKPECWIGSDPSCSIRRAVDPFVEPRHARLYRDEKGNWQAHHNKTLNGLWLRVPQVTVQDSCRFQIGEQRLRLTVGS